APSRNEPERAQVKQLHEDLIAIHRGSSLLRPATLTVGDYSVLGFMVVMSFGSLAGALGVVQLRGRRSDHARERRSKAYRKFKGQYEKINLSSDKAAVSTMGSVFKAYVGDKFNMQGQAMTDKEVVSLLASKGLKADFTQQVEILMRELSKIEYGGRHFG